MSYHLAQMNLAKMIYTTESSEMADFMNNLETYNTLAEASPGYVWRLQTEDGDATGIQFFGKEYIINMSVWEDVESLSQYTYKTAHGPFMGRRREWFQKPDQPHLVLWWVKENHVPTLEEAGEKLELLRANGPSKDAFTFKKAFPPPSAPPKTKPREFEDLCPAN